MVPGRCHPIALTAALPAGRRSTPHVEAPNTKENRSMNIRKRTLLAGGSLALILAGIALAGAHLGVTTGGTAQAAPVPMKRFSVTCIGAGTSTPNSPFGTDWFRKQQDPIVAFGQPVSAHMHDVCGNRAFSSTYSAGTYPIIAGHEADPGYAPAFSNYPTYAFWPVTWNPSALLNGAMTTPFNWTITWQAPVGVQVIT